MIGSIRDNTFSLLSRIQMSFAQVQIFKGNGKRYQIQLKPTNYYGASIDHSFYCLLEDQVNQNLIYYFDKQIVSTMQNLVHKFLVKGKCIQANLHCGFILVFRQQSLKYNEYTKRQFHNQRPIALLLMNKYDHIRRIDFENQSKKLDRLQSSMNQIKEYFLKNENKFYQANTINLSSSKKLVGFKQVSMQCREKMQNDVSNDTILRNTRNKREVPSNIFMLNKGFVSASQQREQKSKKRQCDLTQKMLIPHSKQISIEKIHHSWAEKCQVGRNYLNIPTTSFMVSLNKTSSNPPLVGFIPQCLLQYGEKCAIATNGKSFWGGNFANVHKKGETKISINQFERFHFGAADFWFFHLNIQRKKFQVYKQSDYGKMEVFTGKIDFDCQGTMWYPFIKPGNTNNFKLLQWNFDKDPLNIMNQDEVENDDDDDSI